MPISLPDLETLDPDKVAQAHAYITQLVTEFDPSVDTKRGVLHDIVVHLEGVFSAANEEWADRLRRSGSLLEIQNDPTLADDSQVDALLSNFRIERKPGEAAAGRVVIVLSALVPSNVPAATRFAAQGREFVTETAFAGRTSQASVVTDQDRLIRAVGDGTYSYVIDVVAADAGSSGMLRRNTRLEPQALIPNVLFTYAESDFTGGLNAETNAELVDRLRLGLAGRDVSNRDTIGALVRNTEQFERVLALAVAGYGDPEQRRYHGILPVATGGRMDVYARTQELPQTVRLEKAAVLVDHVAGGGIWQVSIARDDAPGFYDVTRIVRDGADETTAGYEVTEDTRVMDLSPVGTDDFLPDVVAVEEGVYSRYQAGIVRFLDPDTDASLAVGSTAEYVVFARAVPLIAELQEFLGGRGVRPASGDVLVRAPVPCDVRLNVTVYKRTGQADPDTASITSALAAEVNRQGFVGRLAASSLAAVVHRFLTDGQSTGAFDLHGIIRRPDGTKRMIRNPAALEIPDEGTRGVSGRTVVFYLDPEDVTIGVTTAAVPPV
jgi:hypothetical protein